MRKIRKVYILCTIYPFYTIIKSLKVYKEHK